MLLRRCLPRSQNGWLARQAFSASPLSISTNRPSVSIEELAGLRILQISREDEMNSLDFDVAKEIHNWVSVWNKNTAVTGIVLRGTGGVYCGGADLDWLAENRDLAPELYSALGELYRTMLDSSSGKPIVSLVDGDVNGSGLGLSGGRYSVVTDSARFSVPEASLGLVPDGPVLKMLAECEARSSLKGVAAYLSLTGCAVTSDDMMRLGLATHQVPDNTSATELLRHLASLSAADMDSQGATLENTLGLYCEWHNDKALDAVARSVITDSTGVEICEAQDDSGLWSEEKSDVVSGCFGFETSVEESWARLEERAPSNPFAASALAALAASPALSLVATHRLAKECSVLSPVVASSLAQRVATRISAAEPFGKVIEHAAQGTMQPLTTRGDIAAVDADLVTALFEP
mmetsp:Transcript_39815/g.80321  ORF Transcript_39815/g.80321 Transcript_39815/m.80321 type:complete len:405 (-) Transcript_39815:243-1457(-)